MNNPRDLINQAIKGHITPTELMNRSEVCFTYKARDSRAQQELILKYYPPLESPELQAELMSALRAQASHRGPRLVPVVDFGPHPSGGAWVATERVRHPNLLRYVRSKGKLSAQETIGLLIAITDALDGLHEGGAVHGNLKPTNIFLNDRGEARSLRVTDLVDSSLCGIHKVNNAPFTFNDPSFFTYEQASGKEVSASTDIGAIGLIGYFMLTNELPFEGRTTDKLLAAVIINSGRLKLTPSEFEGGETQEAVGLAELLKSCLAKPTSKRPASLRALRASLEALGGVAELPPLEAPGPRTIAPGDMGALFGASGPQTMMYQSVDDDAMAMLEAARAEYEAQHKTPDEGLAPSAQLGVGSGGYATELSLGRVPLSTAQLEAIEDTPPPVPPALLGPSSTLMGIAPLASPQAPPATINSFGGFDVADIDPELAQAMRAFELDQKTPTFTEPTFTEPTIEQTQLDLSQSELAQLGLTMGPSHQVSPLPRHPWAHL
jgi:serine/threonine protein kinase